VRLWRAACTNLLQNRFAWQSEMQCCARVGAPCSAPASVRVLREIAPRGLIIGPEGLALLAPELPASSTVGKGSANVTAYTRPREMALTRRWVGLGGG
jgi:hypothetical protein